MQARRIRRGALDVHRRSWTSRTVAGRRNVEPDFALTVALPPEQFELLAERVAKILGETEVGLADADRGGWPEWMSVETAARYLDVPAERVRKLKSRGKIPHYQEAPGCRIFFRRSDLEEWMSGFGRWRGSSQTPRRGPEG
jgi:excisionase family DNA binding protein